MRLMKRRATHSPSCHGARSLAGASADCRRRLLRRRQQLVAADSSEVWRDQQVDVEGRQFDPASALLVSDAAAVAVVTEFVVGVESAADAAGGELFGRLHCLPSCSSRTDY